ncbi:MAG: hypothetical protein K0R75_2411 [Paenibacillaceae bacterium]|nr:hypothetical protein [Paenibacillaceae bacterium]
MPMIDFSIALAACLIAIMISNTPWAQQNLKWLTSYPFYILAGIVLGVSLAALCLYTVKTLNPDLFDSLNLPVFEFFCLLLLKVG